MFAVPAMGRAELKKNHVTIAVLYHMLLVGDKRNIYYAVVSNRFMLQSVIIFDKA